MRSLYPLVFTTGAVTLGMELSAARLLEPALGSNQILWATLIGMVLLYLAVGGWLGGLLADRYPRRRELDMTLTLGAVAVAAVPLLSGPALRLATAGFSTLAASLLASALLAVLTLFSVPGILLGTATPWAIRLALPDAQSAGATVGRLYAVATAGSIVGAFLPVLWLIPSYGTRWTFYLLALWLLTMLLLSSWSLPHRWTAPAGICVVVLLIWLQPPNAPLRSGWEEEQQGAIIFEDESLYNYIAVRQWGSERHLELNDGIGIHSVYHPDSLLSQGIWDYFLIAPLTTPASTAILAQGVLVIGLAAGTVPALLTEIYGPAPITGVELDPAIIDVGRRFFAMTEPNLTAVAADGRRWLAAQPAADRWGLIVVDAYRPPYIPFHLTTVEFFAQVAAHLTADGVVAINVGRTDTNDRLVDALVVTLRQVFPHVLVIDEPGPPHTLANSLVVAGRSHLSQATVAANLAALPATTPSEFRSFAERVLPQVRLPALASTAPIFTDDHAPVERLVHGIIVDYLVGGP